MNTTFHLFYYYLLYGLWRQGHVPRNFKPLAEFIRSNAEGLGRTF